MSLLVLIASLTLLACLAAFIAFRLLINLPLIKHFLLGITGLLCAGLAAAAVLSAWDLYSYRGLLKESSVATISFQQESSQLFRATLVVDGEQTSYLINGDQWQIDARVIKWGDSLSRLGLTPVYRLERLSGRYASIRDEHKFPHSAYTLISHQQPLDVGFWISKTQSRQNLVDAEYGSAAYLPMVDGASYSVLIGNTGLLARPNNEKAKKAVANWSS